MADGNSSLQDDELYLPRTVVNKLIKEIVPNIRVSTDARDLLLNCCTEFIHLLASEASDISEKQLKKVISPEHVVEALTTLGFQEYVPDVKAVHKEYKEQASKHRKRGKSKLDRLGIPEEELARQQQQLFDEARQQQMESEMLDQQRQLSQPTLGAASTSVPSLASQLAPFNNSLTSPAPGPATMNTSVSRVGTSEKDSVAKQDSQLGPSSGTQSFPQGAAITAASLQATSNLLQQALAMASVKMATGQTEPQPNILQQSAALQAALAAQKLAPAQSQSLMLLQQTQRQASASADAPILQPIMPAQVSPGQSQAATNSAVVTSQELSVAQMMMTLAQASKRNAGTLESSNSQNSSPAQKHPDNTRNNP